MQRVCRCRHLQAWRIPSRCTSGTLYESVSVSNMSGLPPIAWESELSTAVGLTVSEFRFAVSFFLSVFISWCWRFVPTVQGEQAQHTVACPGCFRLPRPCAPCRTPSVCYRHRILPYILPFWQWMLSCIGAQYHHILCHAVYATTSSQVCLAHQLHILDRMVRTQS